MERDDFLKKIARYGQNMVGLSIVFFIVYNTFFGWNVLPESSSEVFCDKLCVALFRTGVAMYIYPLISLYIKWYRK